MVKNQKGFDEKVETKVGDVVKSGPYEGFTSVSKYSSDEAVEDGFLMALDLIAKWKRAGQSPLKYVTTGLLEKGYWNDQSCTQKSLNMANMLDLIAQSLRVFRKKASDDYFVSGVIELPDGKKQKIFISENETGRYTVMLPEEY